MKKSALLLIFVLFIFVLISSAQEKSEWTRVETANKEISVSFPSDFLVDVVKKDYDKQSLRIIAFQNQVQMELMIYDFENPKKYLQQLEMESESKVKIKTESKKIGTGKDAFTLKRFLDDEDNRYFAETIFIASNSNLYCLNIYAENADKPEVSRFLFSIKTRGKSIFIKKNEEDAITEKVISTADLKTSPEILAALDQKNENISRKINYEFKKFKLPENSIDFSSRPYIILVAPYPSGTSNAVKPAFLVSRLGQDSGEAVFKVKLLSNGQIGDVTVFSISDRRILYEFIEGIKKVRFIPSEKNGKPIDSEWIFSIATDRY